MTIVEIILIILLCLLIFGICFFIPILLKKIQKRNNDVTSADMLEKMGEQIGIRLEKEHEKNIEMIQKQLDTNFKQNKENIADIKKIVTEDLNKSVTTKFNESFKSLNETLTKVLTAAGELKNYGSSADKLLKAMTNVKVSGIFGEVQLKNILDNFLAPNQYETQFQVKKNQERVDFAIKIPTSDNNFVYVPIDSKFPLTLFNNLVASQEKNDENLIKLNRSQLKSKIIQMAKDIHEKYINPPITTPYAIMFLPTENLFSEVIKMGLWNELQQKYQVTISGPINISAILMSFMLVYQSFTIRQNASNVITMLSALKTQFNLMEGEITSISKGFDKSTEGFNKLLNTRFRMIKSKIKSIDEMPLNESNKLIGVDDIEQIETKKLTTND